MGQNIFHVNRIQATLICYGEFDLAYTYCRRLEIQCITVKEMHNGQQALFIFLPSVDAAERLTELLWRLYEPLQGK